MGRHEVGRHEEGRYEVGYNMDGYMRWGELQWDCDMRWGELQWDCGEPSWFRFDTMWYSFIKHMLFIRQIRGRRLTEPR
jgi:hypothetical protein